MKTPLNSFKQALRDGPAQIGLWLGLADAYSAEICAQASFDWLLIDGEHAPNDLRSILAHLQMLAAYPVHPVVRLPFGHGDAGAALIKQVLDCGAQTLMIPMVDTPEQAAALVAACRYPQADGQGGMRGMAGARASRWGQISDYVQAANEQVGLLVQVETRTALDNLEAIANTPGVDGVFIGPADLSASMGYPGQPHHDAVVTAINAAIARIQRCGKAAGILATQPERARECLALGARFVAVGLDTQLLGQGARGLAAQFKTGRPHG